MAAADAVASLFQELQSFIKQEDFAGCLSVSEKSLFVCFHGNRVCRLTRTFVSAVLQKNPSDEVALRCKIVALTHLSRFDDVVALTASPAFAFESAYALYRLNQMKASFDRLMSIPAPRPTRVQRLFGQVVCPLPVFFYDA
jgi:hypothetical protein